MGELDKKSLTKDVSMMLDDISSFFTMIDEDRPTDKLLRETIGYIQQKRWNLYES